MRSFTSISSSTDFGVAPRLNIKPRGVINMSEKKIILARKEKSTKVNGKRKWRKNEAYFHGHPITQQHEQSEHEES